MKLKQLKQKKLILVKLIGIGNDDKDEDDSIEKEGYKYNSNDGVEYESEDDGI